MAMLRRNSDAMATVMDGNGWCNSNAMATTVVKCGGNGGGTLTSDGRHRSMLAHYNRASVHIELLSFGYKYCAPPHRSWDGFTYAHPLSPLDVRDLDRAPGHVLKFNSLLYLVRRSLLIPPGGSVNNNRRRGCDGNCDDDNVYGDNGGGATTM